MTRTNPSNSFDDLIQATKPPRDIQPDFSRWCREHQATVDRFSRRSYQGSHAMLPGHRQRYWRPVLRYAMVACVGLMAGIGMMVWWRLPFLEPASEVIVVHPNGPSGVAIATLIQEKACELELARTHFEQGDQAALLVLLASDFQETRICVARYLGTMGNLDALPVLEGVQDTWAGAPEENPYTQAIVAIQNYYGIPASSPVAPVGKTVEQSPSSTTESQEEAPQETFTQVKTTRLDTGTVIELSDIQKLIGQVVKPNGKPIPHAEITVLPMTLTPSFAGPDGRFEIDWSPSWYTGANDESVRPFLLIRDPNHAFATMAQWSPPMGMRVFPLEECCTLNLRIPKNLLQLTYTDPNGVRLPKAIVRLSLAPLEECYHRMPLAVGGAMGANLVTFEGLPNNWKYRLVISPKGHYKLELKDGLCWTRKGVCQVMGKKMDEIDLRHCLSVKPNPLETEEREGIIAQAFHPAYDLGDSEVLRYIRAPFVVERQDHLSLHGKVYEEHAFSVQSCRKRLPHGTEVELFYVFGCTRGLSLKTVLGSVLGLRESVFEISDTIEDLIFPLGDWIVKEEASETEKLRALEAISRYVLHRRISCERIEVGDERGRPKPIWLISEVMFN